MRIISCIKNYVKMEYVAVDLTELSSLNVSTKHGNFYFIS